MMENKRLKEIANLISAKQIIDVGSDHGYLPIYLLKNDKIDQAIIIEINVDPLLNAKKNALKYGVDQKITYMLSNGIRELKSANGAEIIISGMGGNLIINILNENFKILKERLIIQPNNNEIIVRKQMKKWNFHIEKEVLIKENKIIYSILVINPKKENDYTESEITLGKYENKILLNEKLKAEKNHLINIYNKIPEEKKTKELKERINKYNLELGE